MHVKIPNLESVLIYCISILKTILLHAETSTPYIKWLLEFLKASNPFFPQLKWIVKKSSNKNLNLQQEN